MHRPGWIHVVCVGMIAVLALGGCSSSEDDSPETSSSSSEPSDESTSSGPALTGDPVKLGVITDASGSTGTNTSMADTAERWVDYTNSHGGINGRPVEVIVKDTQNNAAKALQSAKELVEQDKVLAIGDDSYLNTSFAEYLAEKRIPAISMGPGFFSFNYVTDANFFSATTNVTANLWGLTKSAALAGKTNLAYMYCAELASCAQAVPLIEGFIESNGGELAYSAGFSASAPNYTAQCLAARDAGVDALLVGGTVVSANQRFYKDCATQGFKPLAVLAQSGVSTAVLNDPLTPLATSVTGVLPWFETKGAGSEAFHAAMDEYLDGGTSLPEFVASHWVGLEMFKKAVGTSAAPTTADVYKGLYSMKDETIDGLVPPFTITKGQPGSAQCMYAYLSEEGDLSTLNDGEPICAPS